MRSGHLFRAYEKQREVASISYALIGTFEPTGSQHELTVEIEDDSPN